MADEPLASAPSTTARIRLNVDDVILSDGTSSFVGDTVRVLPTKPGGRDGYTATVRRIEQRRDTIEVTVVGGPRGRPTAFHTYTPDRIRRLNPAERRTVVAR